MIRNQISNTIHSQYVEASVELFMEYYCELLFDDIPEADMKAAASAFPGELDTRCRKLIQKELNRQRRKEGWKSVCKGLRYVASLVLILLSVSSVLFFSVEAIRVPVINYYITHSKNGFLLIEGRASSSEIPHTMIDIADPLAGLLPQGYQLILHEENSFREFTAIYENASGKQVFVSARSVEEISGIDTQDADHIAQFQIFNCHAVLVEEKEIARLMWVHEEYGCTFTLVRNDSSIDIVKLAETLISCFDESM